MTSHAQDSRWCDQFLTNAPNTFAVAQQTELEVRLQRENGWLKKLVGELPVEFSTSDETVGP